VEKKKIIKPSCYGELKTMELSKTVDLTTILLAFKNFLIEAKSQ